MTKILVYELNEVPWRVIDRYLASRQSTHLGKLLQTASQLTTHTTDSGELHPWSTWPTMHRGVNNDAHEIRFINQDLTSAQSYPPLWQLLADAGITVGVCGCLQSFPPLAHKNMHFHIPDTFAPAPDTLPAQYQPFQQLNLKLTSENKAIATGVSLKDMTEGLGLFRTGVTLRSGMRLAGHLVSEKLNKLNKSLRATMQAHVAFDVFMDALKSMQPQYAAFFSNHVAGTMHRYWKYAFPEDFQYQLQSGSEFDRFHSQSVFKAMDIFDEQLGILSAFAEQHGYDVVVCSSMGQEAVHRGVYLPELKLDNERLLAEKMGFAGAFTMNLAMQPDINFVFANREELVRFKNALVRLQDADGNPVLRVRYEEQGLTLNLMTCGSNAAYEQGTLLLDGQPLPLAALGFSVFKRDQGTGYHQPNGSLIWKRHRQLGQAVQDRAVVDSRQYAPTILHALGAAVPGYMMEPIALEVSAQRSPTARVA